jgi:subtilisin family serine protease
MRKTLAVTAVATVLLSLLVAGTPASAAASGGGTATIAPALEAVLASLPPGDKVTVVVTLRDRVDPAAVPGTTRAARRHALLQALQAKASTSQAPLRARLRALAARGQVAATTPLWVVNGISVSATAAVIRELAARPDVASIAADDVPVVPTAGTPEPNLVAVQAPAMWDLGHTGQGVVVATLDSGVDVSHPDLAGRWRGGTNSWYDPYGQHPTTPVDLTGHGTATTGVIVGGDAGGTSIGMAPGATWIAAKIFNDQGAATATAIHQAFQWVLDPDHDPATNDAPQIVNGSWSIGAGPGCDLSFQPDLQALRAADIVPVFAAGNYGPGGSSSVSPANYPEALAVGAVTNAGQIYAYSGRGPSTCGGRTGQYPDLVAPGVNILTSERYGLYQVASGTSLSAPHAAGALALLRGALPGLTTDRAQAALTATATDLGPSGPDDAFGYGRFDVLAAYQWLQAQPDLGLSLSPSSASVVAGGAAAFTVDVTPANGFTADVSLSLSGLDPAEASWTFTPSVVPAGAGTSQLSVTTSSAMAPGIRPLTVTATGGGITRTATVTLSVTARPDFTLGATPGSTTVAPGGTADVTVTVGALNGFADPVTLAADGLPAGVGTATLTPTTLAGAGTAQLRLAASAGAPSGTYVVTVTGTSGATTHAVPVTLTVSAPPDFSLSAPTVATVNAGSTTGFSVSVGSLNGFAGTVSLSVAGLPSGVGTASVSPAGLVGSGVATLTVTTLTSAPGDTYPVTVTATSGNLVHTATVTLTVVARDFALASSPASASVARGGTATYTVDVSALGGFTGTVKLSAAGLPSRATATWSRTSVVAPGSATLKVKTSGSTPRGTFTVVITGKSGSVTHQVPVTLTVT